MRIIKDRQICDDPFQTLRDDESLPPQGDVIVSLSRFEQERDALLAHDGRVGVCAAGHTDSSQLAALISQVALIALEIPKYTDGRAYTTARLLRDAYGYAGELRAVGNVLRDQILYLSRVGFDAFELTEGKDLDEALRGFDDFSVHYQPAADQKGFSWRRA